MVTAAGLVARMFLAGLTSVILREVLFPENKVFSFTKSIVIANLLRDLVLFNADKLDINGHFYPDDKSTGYQGHFFEKVYNNYPSKFASTAGFCAFVLTFHTFSRVSYKQTLISGTIFLVCYSWVKMLFDQSSDFIPKDSKS